MSRYLSAPAVVLVLVLVCAGGWVHVFESRGHAWSTIRPTTDYTLLFDTRTHLPYVHIDDYLAGYFISYDAWLPLVEPPQAS